MARRNSRDARGRPNVMQARAQGYADRLAAIRDPIERFLIVCEGEQTEPNYFRSFRVPANVLDVRGMGDNTVNLVKRAIELRDAVQGTGQAYDQIWCVFDRDSFPAKHFNAALQLAKNNAISVTFSNSNEAFEIWYLLHFAYHDAGISRQAYKDKLTELLGHTYEKNSRTIYDDLYSRQPDALRNAEKLHKGYKPSRPEQNNPCTTVYQLVEQLNRFVR